MNYADLVYYYGVLETRGSVSFDKRHDAELLVEYGRNMGKNLVIVSTFDSTIFVVKEAA